MKLSAVSGVVKGKRVVMIDDSIAGREQHSSHCPTFERSGASAHVAIGSPARSSMFLRD